MNPLIPVRFYTDDNKVIADVSVRAMPCVGDEVEITSGVSYCLGTWKVVRSKPRMYVIGDSTREGVKVEAVAPVVKPAEPVKQTSATGRHWVVLNRDTTVAHSVHTTLAGAQSKAEELNVPLHPYSKYMVISIPKSMTGPTSVHMLYNPYTGRPRVFDNRFEAESAREQESRKLDPYNWAWKVEQVFFYGQPTMYEVVEKVDCGEKYLGRYHSKHAADLVVKGLHKTQPFGKFEVRPES